MEKVVMHCTLIVLLQCSVGVLSWGDSDSEDTVLLEKVTAVTLVQGEMTNGRRSSPVSQLDCVGGAVGCNYRYKPKVVKCENVGFDGYDVQWKCTADLDNDVKFGFIEVTCEGYSNPEDPYILRGSCGLRYKLEWTRRGQQKSRSSSSNSEGSSKSRSSNQGSSGSSDSGSAGLSILVFIGLCLCGLCGRNNTSGSSSSSGGGSYSSYSDSYDGSYGNSYGADSYSSGSGSGKRSASGYGGTSRR